MIRYLALAFIVFQVATTTALATQVVLFEGETADVRSSIEPTNATPALPVSHLVDERATQHLLIQIDRENSPGRRP